eukprot:364518-Chlamydomonas_euryale.AAC.7
MGAWEHGSMGAWEHGSMGVWECGSMKAWEHESMGTWECGSGNAALRARRCPLRQRACSESVGAWECGSGNVVLRAMLTVQQSATRVGRVVVIEQQCGSVEAWPHVDSWRGVL